jgi:TATA-binding protein-associated factor Taf7
LQLNEEVDTFFKVVDITCFCLSYLIECGDQYVDGKEVLLQHQPNFICLSGIEQPMENVNKRELFSLVRQRTIELISKLSISLIIEISVISSSLFS